jgi:hypothetical protein
MISIVAILLKIYYLIKEYPLNLLYKYYQQIQKLQKIWSFSQYYILKKLKY